MRNTVKTYLLALSVAAALATPAFAASNGGRPAGFFDRVTNFIVRALDALKVVAPPG
jgi:hypothetical protein